MSDFMGTVALLLGIVLRLAVPVFLTALLVYILRDLDARWQSEATHKPGKVAKPACWEINQCPPQRLQECAGYLSPLPCWQARRFANGYLREECLSCKVFLGAPAPAIG